MWVATSSIGFGETPSGGFAMGQHSRLSILQSLAVLVEGHISCALRFRYLLPVASSPSSVRWCSTLELMVGMIHGEAAILWCHVVP
ncbi:unnamed protein product [Brassica oleracea]